jgi:hypothetical protein
MKNPFRNRARIVTDLYCGYEVQVWRWWFPFWIQLGCNTQSTIEAAEARALHWLDNFVKEVTK